MRVEAPVLLPILRSSLQGGVLAATYLNPDKEFSVRELALLCGATAKATGQEVERLVTTGFLADRRHGNMRLVRRPETGPVVAPLTELLAATFGPLPVLTEELAGMVGLERAFIYGSWAARHQGETGRLPADVDVIAVGHPAVDSIDDAALRAQQRLRREVNIRTVTPEQWENPDQRDVFLASVKSRPLVELPIHDTKEET